MTVFNLDCRLKVTWGAFKNPEAQASPSKIRTSGEKNSGISIFKSFSGVYNAQPGSKSKQNTTLKPAIHT